MAARSSRRSATTASRFISNTCHRGAPCPVRKPMGAPYLTALFAGRYGISPSFPLNCSCQYRARDLQHWTPTSRKNKRDVGHPLVWVGTEWHAGATLKSREQSSCSVVTEL